MRQLTSEDSHPVKIDVDDDGALGMTQTGSPKHLDYILLDREQMKQLHALLGELLNEPKENPYFVPRKMITPAEALKRWPKPE